MLESKDVVLEGEQSVSPSDQIVNLIFESEKKVPIEAIEPEIKKVKGDVVEGELTGGQIEGKKVEDQVNYKLI